MSLPTPLQIRAHMARGGLLPNQLQPYWNPDLERTIDPLKTEDIQREVRRFMAWIDKEMRP